MHIGRPHFSNEHGARHDDIRHVMRFAHNHDLSIVRVDIARRAIILSGTVRNLSRVLGSAWCISTTLGADISRMSTR
jgi:hypothetical protein